MLESSFLIEPHLMVLFVIVGLITGLLSGLTGLGGGVVAVPALIEIFTDYGVAPLKEAQVAIGTSLAVLLVNNFLAAKRYHHAGIIDWGLVRIMAPWMLIGGASGPWLSAAFSSRVLSIFFAFMLLCISLQIFLTRTAERKIHAIWVLRLSALGFGVISGLMGIAGGAFVIPFLMRQGLLTREAAAASVCITMPVVLIASMIYIFIGWDNTAFSAGFLGYIYLPAAACIALLGFIAVPIGTRLAISLPNEILRKVFACIILILGLHLMWVSFV